MALDTRKARQRLRKAQSATADFQAAESCQEMDDAWLDFLLHAKGVYVQLAAASKDIPVARQWFGMKQRERRNDELLQYVYQSRNFVEHELEDGAKHHRAQVLIHKTLGEYSQDIEIEFADDGQSYTITALDGLPLPIVFQDAQLTLLSVFGRGGVAFHPPRSHLGRPVHEPTPLVVAELCVAYLTQLIEEADTRFT